MKPQLKHGVYTELAAVSRDREKQSRSNKEPATVEATVAGS